MHLDYLDVASQLGWDEPRATYEDQALDDLWILVQLVDDVQHSTDGHVVIKDDIRVSEQVEELVFPWVISIHSLEGVMYCRMVVSMSPISPIVDEVVDLQHTESTVVDEGSIRKLRHLLPELLDEVVLFLRHDIDDPGQGP
jgi:hypothetical protein